VTRFAISKGKDKGGLTKKKKRKKEGTFGRRRGDAVWGVNGRGGGTRPGDPGEKLDPQEFEERNHNAYTSGWSITGKGEGS